MEFKGTRGKWEINPRASRNVRCGLITIANCSSGQNGELEEEEKANALLISKSPEMLEMLKEFEDELRCGYVINRNKLGKIQQLIKGATIL